MDNVGNAHVNETNGEFCTYIPVSTRFQRNQWQCLLVSDEGILRLGLFSDGTFGVAYNESILWSATNENENEPFYGDHWKFQQDGNLVVYSDDKAVWASAWEVARNGHGPVSLVPDSKLAFCETSLTIQSPLDTEPSVLWSVSYGPTMTINTTTITPLTESSTQPTVVDSQHPVLMYLAYYYPWYYQGDWSRHDIQNTPFLGFYGTDDPSIAEQHIEWAVHRAKISSWVVSWWGDDSLTKSHFDRGMLQANNIDQILFCMLYESKVLEGASFVDGTAQAMLLTHFQSMQKDYFTHPSYLRLNGRPVVVLYITRTIFGLGFGPEVLDEIRTALGEDIFFIADEPFFGNGHDDPRTAGNGIRPNTDRPLFDAYTTYNMYQGERVQLGETASDFMLREAMPIFERWSNETLFFPNVLPMYHDFRGNQPLIGNAEDFLRQLQAVVCLPRPTWYTATTTATTTITATTATSATTTTTASTTSSSISSHESSLYESYPDLVFVTSWNEWWEGSQIEPDDSVYGFEFIDALAKFKKSVDTNGGYSWC
jgi:hypothetical protein